TGYPIVKEPITLKVMLAIRDVDSLVDINDMPAIQALEQETGIHVEWEVIKGSDWNTKLNLAFASGEYPDVILSVNSPVDKEEFGVTQQLLIPLDELIKKYMPNYTERTEAEENDPTMGLMASDGKHYSVGFMMAQNINVAQHFFINQTWLDNLGLQTPTTLDELTEVLRAFKMGDPNKNGEADEVPLELGLDTGFYGVRHMLPMFGVPCATEKKWIYIDDNKKVQMAATQLGFRQCMEWLHAMYAEGIADAELVSQDINTIETKVKEGNVGFFTAWRLKQMGWEESVEKDCTLFMPTAPEGTKASLARSLELAKNGAYVTAGNQHVPETMRWLDSMLDLETMFSLYYGKEGEAWSFGTNGKIDTAPMDPTRVKDCLDANSLFYAPAKYLSEHYNMAPQRLEKTDYCQKYEAAGIIQKYSNNYLTMAPLTSEQLQNSTLKETDINNAVVENMATFVTNGVTDDSWNTFVKLFDDMQIAEYIQMYQDAINQMEIE
ncbi:MAG: extracellular solute-binding protein, partial [Hungatella sp.]